MSFNAEWTNADALAFRPYTAYASAPVTYSATTDPMSDLQRENAELRELVADAWGYINHPANATWTHKKRKEVRDSLANRMRELGMEVDW